MADGSGKNKASNDYVYHGTAHSLLPFISKHGLDPEASQGATWFHKDINESRGYAEGSANQMAGPKRKGALLRVNLKHLPVDAVQHLPYSNITATSEPIPPEHIEHEQPDGSWKSLAATDITKAGGGEVDLNQQRQQNLANWFEGAHPDLQDEGGVPKRLYVGTLSDFGTFNRSKMNVQGDHGQGFYATDNPDDASVNYASQQGADLNSKVGRMMDRYYDEPPVNDETGEPLSEDEIRNLAMQELGVQHHGAVMPVHMTMKNPVVLGGKNETVYDFHEPFNEETEEYGETSGSLMKLIEGVKESGNQFDHPTDEIVGNLYERARDYGELPATVAEEIIKKGFEHAYDPDTGDMAANEAWRTALEEAGHDGIIDHTVDSKFGSSRRGFGGAKIPGMHGVQPNTTHYVAFDNKKIKSATGNTRFDPTVPDITKAGGGEVDDEEGITAYHGSPYDFERFDISKIGTGEGAQAYGHGLYFAGSEDVAKYYRDMLANEVPSSGKTEADAYSLSPEQYAMMDENDLAQYMEDIQRNASETLFDRGKYKHLFSDRSVITDEGNRLSAAQKEKGHMYEVNIKAHPHHFLDWDEVFEDQSDHVKNALRRIAEHDEKQMGYSDLTEYLEDPDAYAGGAFYHYLSGRGREKEASEIFDKFGIKGIRYKDAASRLKDGEPSYNYVVFNHDHVNVRRKYKRGGVV
jgi:hypothetical protein